jgi:serpin B
MHFSLFLFLSFYLGSEAAAATAVVMNRCLAIHVQSPPIEFKANRPFLFFIRERQQNVVLFSGRFVSPPTASG